MLRSMSEFSNSVKRVLASVLEDCLSSREMSCILQIWSSPLLLKIPTQGSSQDATLLASKVDELLVVLSAKLSENYFAGSKRIMSFLRLCLGFLWLLVFKLKPFMASIRSMMCVLHYASSYFCASSRIIDLISKLFFFISFYMFGKSWVASMMRKTDSVLISFLNWVWASLLILLSFLVNLRIEQLNLFFKEFSGLNKRKNTFHQSS